MEFLTGLNDAQNRAVVHHTGPLLVVAGAGSGKTRALTHRIAYLISKHNVSPTQILAVTFTNKAAREMKERLSSLLEQQLAESRFSQPWNTLELQDQQQLKKHIRQGVIKELWIGTFHALFARILRLDVEKLHDVQGLRWTRQFSIFDEVDTQKLIKKIVTQEMQLDLKRFDPKKIRWMISSAKNQGWLPDDFELQLRGQQGRLVAEAYRCYRKALAANNALDFDDLLLLSMQLLQQNTQVRSYWHHRFRHILVDEYQDTNHTQYELIKLLVTNSSSPATVNDWSERSVFVVGDADQSIYSFRAADFTILMGFQKDFGDGAPDNLTHTMVKLEENYRSTSTILEAANALIANNSKRIEKVLRPTRYKGEPIVLTCCNDEVAEAEMVVHRLQILKAGNPSFSWRDMAVLYRTNAQSRSIEEALVHRGIPYLVISGLRFYDRREIKDVLAYLRLLVNPNDSISLLRVLNVPRRGIGKVTVQRLTDAANQLCVPLWEVVSDPVAARALGSRSAKGILQFTELIRNLQLHVHGTLLSVLIQKVIEQTGYASELAANGGDEAEERRHNLQELVNAALQFQEENDEADLENFLASAALASDSSGDNNNVADHVTLMTLHSSKGLEFPVVCMVGLEQGLFPSHRSLEDSASLEEERRLCYVGITRAMERLFIYYASERRLWGGVRETSLPSIFLSELPKTLVQGDLPQPNRLASRVERPLNHLAQISCEKSHRGDINEILNSGVTNTSKRSLKSTWLVGKRVCHALFGDGEIIHVFGRGEKISIAVKFNGIGPKIIDPRTAPIKVLPHTD
ncbi:ATPase AAA [cyanobiont of Ornithocercus magnificus]|nr:ATPase AAA [cyanobiont of Ornithocercus magnificus]